MLSTHNSTSKVKDERQRINPKSHKPRHCTHECRGDSEQRIEKPECTSEGGVLGGRRVPVHEVRAFDMVVSVAVSVAACAMADDIDVACESNADSKDDSAADELLQSSESGKAVSNSMESVPVTLSRRRDRFLHHPYLRCRETKRKANLQEFRYYVVLVLVLVLVLTLVLPRRLAQRIRLSAASSHRVTDRPVRAAQTQNSPAVAC